MAVVHCWCVEAALCLLHKREGVAVRDIAECDSRTFGADTAGHGRGANKATGSVFIFRSHLHLVNQVFFAKRIVRVSQFVFNNLHDVSLCIAISSVRIAVVRNDWCGFPRRDGSIPPRG